MATTATYKFIWPQGMLKLCHQIGINSPCSSSNNISNTSNISSGKSRTTATGAANVAARMFWFSEPATSVALQRQFVCNVQSKMLLGVNLMRAAATSQKWQQQQPRACKQIRATYLPAKMRL